MESMDSNHQNLGKQFDISHLSGWWFQTWLLFSAIYGIILPIDELIFFKMVETTNQKKNVGIGQNPIPLVDIKIAGKWVFIALKKLVGQQMTTISTYAIPSGNLLHSY